MEPRTFLFVGVTAAAIVAAACGGSGGEERSWADAPSAELQPSGMVLSGGTASSEPESQPLAIDGTGAVWTRGPWQLTRVEADGRATTWDGADDMAFALDPPRLIASDEAGVWLVFQQSIRLFDGHRFVVDLTVPDDLMNVIDDPAALRFVQDAAEVGPGEVWVALWNSLPTTGDEEAPAPDAGRVVRFSAGLWSTVADFDRTVVDIVVDAEGAPWVSLAGGDETAANVQRWDGSRFVVPSADDPDVPIAATGLVAAPDRGVYVLDTPPSHSVVRRFDGTAWSAVADGVFDHIGTCWGGSAMAADATGVWLAGSDGIAHLSNDGTWSDVAIEQSSTSPGVVARGDRAVVRTAAGLFELDEQAAGMTPIWTDDAIQVRAAGSLQAVSADELWIGTHRYLSGTWSDPFGDGTDEAVSGAAATDGAMWFALPSGLSRFIDDAVSVVAQDVTTGGVVAGPDASVWVVVGGDVVGVAPDGTRTTIGHPASGDVECLLAGGPDGSVWVDTGCVNSPVSVVARWDGTGWHGVELPGPDVWVVGITATDDGTTWGAFLGDLDDPASGVAYYADGTWHTFPGWPSTLSAGPGGRACSLDDATQTTPDTIRLRCYDTGGLVASYDVPWDVWTVSIAPDGAVWVGGSQIARLGATVEPT